MQKGDRKETVSVCVLSCQKYEAREIRRGSQHRTETFQSS